MTDLINTILNADVRAGLRQLSDSSIDCVFTSPPYWSLRAYGTEPQVWDGKEGCVHEWETEFVRKRTEGDKPGLNSLIAANRPNDTVNRPDVKNVCCSLCGAWKGELGLEPTFNDVVTEVEIMGLCSSLSEDERKFVIDELKKAQII